MSKIEVFTGLFECPQCARTFELHAEYDASCPECGEEMEPVEEDDGPEGEEDGEEESEQPEDEE